MKEFEPCHSKWIRGRKEEKGRKKYIRRYGAATRKMREETPANGILWVGKQKQSGANEQ